MPWIAGQKLSFTNGAIAKRLRSRSVPKGRRIAMTYRS